VHRGKESTVNSYTLKSLALVVALVVNVVLLVVTGAALLGSPADASTYQSNGRYHLGNADSVDTSIVTIKVRDAHCLTDEGDAATLRIVHKPSGYSPATGSVKYKCTGNSRP
jgi:hypothetical protein